MESFLRSTQAQPQVTFYVSGTPTSADGDVTVTMVGDCGGTLVASGTATAAGTASPGVYSYALAPQANLDVIEATWSGTFTGVVQSVRSDLEIQGAFHVAIAELRARTQLSSEVAYPDAVLRAGRLWWEDMAEAYCNVAFVPRAAREYADGDGGKVLWLDNYLPRSLRSLSVGGTAVADLSEFYLYPSGRLVRDDGGVFTAGYHNIEICYEHGMDSPPTDVHDAALVAIEEHLLGDATGVPARAETVRTEFASIELGTLPPIVVRVLNEHVREQVLAR